ncbi:hypothetical protein NE237_025423 [Protea cynaroides]|uniref:Uncharacterized protein n=1 Tax=Protea cynaroides TaxID=273540 RepID=A0A9Q0H1V6_9MAGN|nr:hypothetical protein NE237_025423 [Protea cynaroides]
MVVMEVVVISMKLSPIASTAAAAATAAQNPKSCRPPAMGPVATLLFHSARPERDLLNLPSLPILHYYVELRLEVVELPILHKREEELYFYDAFTSPWEKEKDYKMVYQLEKKDEIK